MAETRAKQKMPLGNLKTFVALLTMLQNAVGSMWPGKWLPAGTPAECLGDLTSGLSAFTSAAKVELVKSDLDLEFEHRCALKKIMFTDHAKIAAAAAGVWLCSEAFVPGAQVTREVQAPSHLRSGTRGRAAASSGLASTATAGAALLAAGACAARSRKVCKSFENEVGVTLPMKYFDPLGMAKDDDSDDFRRRRMAEVKNGRVAMLACMGYIAPEYFRLPGLCSPSKGLAFADIPNGIQALYKMPAEGWAQIAIFIGFLELFPMRQEKDRMPGDFPGFSKLGFVGGSAPADPSANQRSLEAEINNGRLAMVAITGMVAQNAFFGTTGPAMWLPSSAFEGELGVQAPVGFWDPIGLSADGDVDTFKRRRAVELKHGRICMLACVGYIVPEYFRWPGYLSPEKGLKFADMPHGIAAISKVPLEGWLQIVLFIGHYEGYFWRQDPKRAPGDYEGYGFLGVGKNFIINVDPIEFQDSEVKKTKLSAEIANGRLAMVALMAMLFQNGTVGSTGPAMWLPAA
ncbi:FCPE [Symbiodinium natans]|uniref:FCPE protein n=1 Tax=Symbiodinium natans TaxID=878477 RepID=A0A812QR74_9DINO|nr:FCPE [Symbiodinium natans]